MRNYGVLQQGWNLVLRSSFKAQFLKPLTVQLIFLGSTEVGVVQPSIIGVNRIFIGAKNQAIRNDI